MGRKKVAVEEAPSESVAENDIQDDVLDDIVASIIQEAKEQQTSKDTTKTGFNKLHARLQHAGEMTSTHLQLSSSKATPAPSMINSLEAALPQSDLYSHHGVVAPPLKKVKEEVKKTLGKGWFDLQPAKLDEELKRDIKIIQMRNYLDPKRFYKNPDKLRTVLHVGTVIEGPTEYKSSRMTNKERKQTIADEIIADRELKSYSKRKYGEIQKENAKKARVFKKQKFGKRR